MVDGMNPAAAVLTGRAMMPAPTVPPAMRATAPQSLPPSGSSVAGLAIPRWAWAANRSRIALAGISNPSAPALRTLLAVTSFLAVNSWVTRTWQLVALRILSSCSRGSLPFALQLLLPSSSSITSSISSSSPLPSLSSGSTRTKSAEPKFARLASSAVFTARPRTSRPWPFPSLIFSKKSRTARMGISCSDGTRCSWTPSARMAAAQPMRLSIMKMRSRDRQSI
mmetsp:Transcript_9987/g.11616  ORF Transcript_9987/g.11616 Transcript_9987/m.11616 type:complete len:224 (-) Transcript_9987:752-1423(-)